MEDSSKYVWANKLNNLQVKQSINKTIMTFRMLDVFSLTQVFNFILDTSLMRIMQQTTSMETQLTNTEMWTSRKEFKICIVKNYLNSFSMANVRSIFPYGRTDVNQNFRVTIVDGNIFNITDIQFCHAFYHNVKTHFKIFKSQTKQITNMCTFLLPNSICHGFPGLTLMMGITLASR